MGFKNLFAIPVRRSLRLKVTLGLVAPLIFVLGTLVAVQFVRHRSAVLENMAVIATQSGALIENSLRHEMLENHSSEVQKLLDALGETNNFHLLYILDPQGKVIFALDGQDVGSYLENTQPDCLPCHRLSPAERPQSVVVTSLDGERVFRSMQPVENSTECMACHPAEKPLVGLVLIDIPMAPMEVLLAADLKETLLWWLGMIAVTVVVVNLVLSRLVLARLERLAHALSQFGHSQVKLRLSSGSEDEIGQLEETFDRMGRRVEAEQAANQALSERLRRQNEQRGELLRRLITAQEDERKRVARELHDDLGQALGGLALRVETTRRYLQQAPSRALEQLDHIQELIKDTTDRMYELIFALRPSALDDLGLVAALRSHAERVLPADRITFQLETEGLNGRLPPEIETALYRAIQEAISNVIRHAQATRLRIRLMRHDGLLEAEIVDNGRGFDPEAVDTDGQSTRGLGLSGMMERVTQCGGELEVLSHPGKGTRVIIRILLREMLDA